MNAVSSSIQLHDVKSPVCSRKLAINWIGLPFFKQTTYLTKLPDSLG
jgi:hypothetical protein